MIELAHRRVELHLRHTFRLSRGATDSRHNLLVELADGELLGRGEAAPIARYGQDVASAERAVGAMAPHLKNPELIDRAVLEAAQAANVGGESAAQAALDMALWDLAGLRAGVPVYQLLGLDPRRTPLTTFTIGLDTPEVVAAKVREASDFEVLKIKLGGPDDRAVIDAVRDTTDRPLRVDANEGWTFDQAQELLPWLAARGVELVEQPLPAAELEATRELRRTSPLPLWADESVFHAADVPRLAGAFDGINLKLMKTGGLSQALHLIHAARTHGLGVMLGCMIESSLGITAAAHLSPLVDAADLDGNLLITNDPFVGVTVVGGRLVLPQGPGFGVTARGEEPR